MFFSSFFIGKSSFFDFLYKSGFRFLSFSEMTIRFKRAFHIVSDDYGVIDQ